MHDTDNLLFYRGFWPEVQSRIFSYYRKSLKNPAWLLMSVTGRFLSCRHIAKLWIRSSRRSRPIQPDLSSSIFRSFDLDQNQVTESLKQDGFYVGIDLPCNILEELLDFAYTAECYGDQEHHCGFTIHQKSEAEKKSKRTFNSAHYYNTSLLCPTINKLGKDPVLLGIARNYLGTEPIFTGSRLWWLFAVDEALHDPNQTISFFHYDLDDYSTLRFFFYLTDVDSFSAPHVCVKTSHRRRKLAHTLSPVKRRSDREIINFYGKENIISICGKAGFGFAEDLFCFHKAARPISNDRLMLQIQFAMIDYGNHTDRVESSRLKNVLE